MTAKKYSINWGYVDKDIGDEISFFEEHVTFKDVKRGINGLISEHGENLDHLSIDVDTTSKKYSLIKRIMRRIA